MQTVVAGAPTSSPTKRLLVCPSFTEAQAVGEVTAMVTDIDNAQPLELNAPKDATETCITTEVDVGSMTRSVSEESALSDSHIPVDVLLSKATKAARKHFDFDKGTVLVEGKPLQEQIKFMIFEEAILDVFGQCVQCGSKCVITPEKSSWLMFQNLHCVFNKQWTLFRVDNWSVCVKNGGIPSLTGFCNFCNRNGIIESSSSISSVKDSKPEATQAVQHLKVLHYSRSVQCLERGTISEIARGQREANCNCIRYACGQSWT